MKRSARIAGLVVTLVVISASLGAAAEDNSDRGPVLAADFSGASVDPAWVYRLNATTGYKFSKHFEMDLGVPVYFVRVPAGNTDGFTSKNGIGNVYIDPRLMLSHGNFSFTSDLLATAPTGNEEYGFSTGRATVDWSNYFGLSVGRFTPFMNLGLANTVSDTNFFARPFTSLGVVGHLEGGLTVSPVRWATITGSAYSILPSGQQTIISKLISRPANAHANANANAMGNGTGSVMGNPTGKGNSNSNAGSSMTSPGNGMAVGHNRVFETVSEVVGDSSLAKDHGFSGWIDINPSSKVTLEAGYSRSVAYAYNSVFFSVRFDLAHMLRRSH